MGICNADWTPERKRLKKGATPSKNLPLRSHDGQGTEHCGKTAKARSDRAAVRAALRDVSNCLNRVQLHEASLDTDVDDSPLSDAGPNPGTSERSSCSLMSTSADTQQTCTSGISVHQQSQKAMPDMSVQVNTLEEMTKLTVADLLTRESDFCTFTGVPSFAVFERIVFHVNRFDRMNADLPLKHRVLLVLVRLKTGLSCNCLVPLFNVSETTVHRYFHATLPVLAQVLRTALHRSEKAEVEANMPICFASFTQTRLVLDGTEVEIEKSKCLACRIKTYSSYKGWHTC